MTQAALEKVQWTGDFDTCLAQLAGEGWWETGLRGWLHAQAGRYEQAEHHFRLSDKLAADSDNRRERYISLRALWEEMRLVLCESPPPPPGRIGARDPVAYLSLVGPRRQAFLATAAVSGSRALVDGRTTDARLYFLFTLCAPCSPYVQAVAYAGLAVCAFMEDRPDHAREHLEKSGLFVSAEDRGWLRALGCARMVQLLKMMGFKAEAADWRKNLANCPCIPAARRLALERQVLAVAKRRGGHPVVL